MKGVGGVKKEAEAAIRFIEKSGEQCCAVKTEAVSCDADMLALVDAIGARVKDVVVIVVAVDNEANTLYVAALVPDRARPLLVGWLERAVTTVVFPGASYESLRADAAKVRYQQSGEHSAFKLQDQVVATAFGELKRAGLYKEPEEEYEYVFEDLDS